MTKNLITVVDVSTNEISQREMTLEEFATWELDSLESKKVAEKNKAKEQAKESAKEKLAALGLSPEEISAITGA